MPPISHRRRACLGLPLLPWLTVASGCASPVPGATRAGPARAPDASAEPARALDASAEPALMPLWQGQPMAEADWPGGHAGDGTGQLSADGQRLTNVGWPTLAVYPPAPGRATGTAMLVAPGGGLRFLAIQNEGVQIAHWLAERGVTAFLLRYRTFHEPAGETPEQARDKVFAALRAGWAGHAAAADGLQAMRLIRRRAAEWGVNPQRVGAIGFSAGAHVAGMAGLATEAAARADFVALVYGSPLGAGPLPPAFLPDPPGSPTEPWLRPPGRPAPGALPPMFLAMAQDDRLVGSGVRGFYEQLFAAGYRPELHLFRSGGHGFGLAPRGRSSDNWSAALAAWLLDLGLLAPASAT